MVEQVKNTNNLYSSLKSNYAHKDFVYSDLNSLFFTGIFQTHWIKMKSLKILNQSDMEGLVFSSVTSKISIYIETLRGTNRTYLNCHNLPTLHRADRNQRLAAPMGSKIMCICMWSLSPRLPLDLGWSPGIRKHRCPTPSRPMAPSSQPSFPYREGEILFLNGLRFRSTFLKYICFSSGRRSLLI